MLHQKIVEAIKDRLSQQYAYYERIHELSQQEKAALEEVDDNSLMKILNRKQKYLAKIETLKVDLLKLKEAWEPIKAQVPQEYKDELKVLTDKIEEKLKLIVELEKTNMERAQLLKNEASKKINTYKKGSSAVKSYLGAGRDVRRAYMDKKL